MVLLNEDRLRAYHPAWRTGGEKNSSLLRAGAVQPEIDYWFERAIQDARKQRLHLLIEDELRDPRSLLQTVALLRKERYVVQAVFLSTSRDDSALALLAQYDLQRARALPARFVSAQEHDMSFAHVRKTIGLLEDRRAVDGVRLVDRNASHIYENRLIDGDWRRDPRAQASLDVLREKARAPKELFKLAIRWENLARRLAHDPTGPRDVASQVLVWRNEAIARCDAVPAAAQMLQWAREASAFRVMDRFEFEREFPHHARAAKSLGAAVIEAENFEPPAGARFIASARENIAHRIERGDMARIAAREKSQEPPTR